MKLKKLNFVDFQTLEEEEMKNILGGNENAGDQDESGIHQVAL